MCSIVQTLWLNYRTQGKHFATRLWWATALLVVICLEKPINPLNSLFLVRSRWCTTHKFCGHDRGTSWGECWHEMYASKRAQKYSMTGLPPLWYCVGERLTLEVVLSYWSWKWILKSPVLAAKCSCRVF